MAFEKKPSSDHGSGRVRSAEELETYGVWVKSGPQDMDPETAGPAGFADSAGFGPGFDDARGAASGASSYPFAEDDGFDEGSFETPGFEDAEFERAEFESADFEESAFDPAPPGFGDESLSKIADEVSLIRSELDALKKEMASLRSGGASGTKSEADGESRGGFFSEEDDGKIALTDSEMDNILASSSFEDDFGDRAFGGDGLGDSLRDEDEAALREIARQNEAAREGEGGFSDTEAAGDIDDFGFLSGEGEGESFGGEDEDDIFRVFDDNLPSTEIDPLGEADEIRELRVRGADPLNPPPEDTAYLESDPFAEADGELPGGDAFAEALASADSELFDEDIAFLSDEPPGSGELSGDDDLPLDDNVLLGGSDETPLGDDGLIFGGEEPLDDGDLLLDGEMSLDDDLALEEEMSLALDDDDLPLDDNALLGGSDEAPLGDDGLIFGGEVSFDDGDLPLGGEMSLDDDLALGGEMPLDGGDLLLDEELSLDDGELPLEDGLSLDDGELALDEELSLDGDYLSIEDDGVFQEDGQGADSGEAALPPWLLSDSEIAVEAAAEALQDEPPADGGVSLPPWLLSDSEELGAGEHEEPAGDGDDELLSDDMELDVDEFEIGDPDDEGSSLMREIPEGFSPVDDDLEAIAGDEGAGESKAADLGLSRGARGELKAVLAYMDELLESLPEEKIEEFAKSEHFEAYRKIFKELGLS